MEILYWVIGKLDGVKKGEGDSKKEQAAASFKGRPPTSREN